MSETDAIIDAILEELRQMNANLRALRACALVHLATVGVATISPRLRERLEHLSAEGLLEPAAPGEAGGAAEPSPASSSSREAVDRD